MMYLHDSALLTRGTELVDPMQLAHNRNTQHGILEPELEIQYNSVRTSSCIVNQIGTTDPTKRYRLWT